MSESNLSDLTGRRLSRRSALAGFAGLSAVALAGCQTGDGGSSDGSSSGSAEDRGEFPRTIKHAFGETEIESAPERVATVSWANQDAALALGVVPVGMPIVEFGGNENGSTDWFDEKLEEVGGEAPEQYSETDGIDFEAIAALNPDVILGVYSGLTQEDYDRLSEIAPTVAYPEGTQPFGTSWQDTTRGVGEALGATVEVQIAPGYPVTANHPEQTRHAAEAAAAVAGGVLTDIPPMMGGEDFSYMLLERPGAYIFVGNGDTAMVHHPAYVFDDNAIPAGSSWYAEIAERRMPLAPATTPTTAKAAAAG